MAFLLRTLANAAAILLTAALIPGISIDSAAAALLAGVVLGFINALVKPVLTILTLPLTLMTLGLFLFVLNAICLGLTAWLVPGFSISGLLPAIAGAFFVSVVSWVLTAVAGTNLPRDG